jgi:hypothetical protein
MIMSEERDNIKELLSAYIDGEVTSEQSRAVEQAVAKDPELALELHELTATRRLVMGLPQERAPRGFVRRVMARAERKHLLGDRHAGGAFSAARWITLAVAAVVLLTAGIGIIAVNMLSTDHRPPRIANVDVGSDGPGGPGHMDFNAGSLHGKAGDGRNEKGTEAGGSSATTNGGAVGGRDVTADTAFKYALTNARNTSIYTHDVSNTLAVLHDTFDRNDVLPLEGQTPARDSKAADKPVGKGAKKKRGVSRGRRGVYYNEKENDQQVQIVVLASDTVIEQLNGDLDRLAIDQKVSQAPASDHYRARSGRGYVAPRAGSPGTQQNTDPSNRDEEGMVIARVDGVHTGLGVTPGDPIVGKGEGDGIRAKGKMKTNGGAGATPGGTVPAPVVTPEPKAAKPAVGTDIFGGKDGTHPVDVVAAEARGTATPGSKQPREAVSQTGNAGQDNGPATAVTNSGVQKKEPTGRGDKHKPATPKRLVAGPTTRLAEIAQVAGGIQKGFGDGKNNKELDILSAQIAKEQNRGTSNKQLDVQYGKLNSAFRRQILNDDLRRNVQSQKEQGINVQALVININHRSLKSPGPATTQKRILLRDAQALTRPRATTTSAPASESTTRQATQPADTSK